MPGYPEPVTVQPSSNRFSRWTQKDTAPLVPLVFRENLNLLLRRKRDEFLGKLMAVTQALRHAAEKRLLLLAFLGAWMKAVCLSKPCVRQPYSRDT